VIATGELTPPEQPSRQPVGSIVDGALEKGNPPVNIAHAIDFEFGALTFLIRGVVAIFVLLLGHASESARALRLERFPGCYGVPKPLYVI
jgi:hypothetical protein